ncbi:hypothetical protein JCM10908_006974 [Rhodotorula pacifica]|uniref:uncharacterized protein n=1 Tax=Rhodotorula pacifica TaxID=1495444 RepID=UPI00317890E7
MSDTDYEDPFGAELGAFDIVADSSAATARQQRIEAARKAARTYQAKIEEPGWYNSLDPDSRSKDLSRLVLFSLHHKYYERQYLEVVNAGCELLAGEVKEQSEVIDLVLRAAAKCDLEVQRRAEVLSLARRWREFPHLASLSLASARILAANSPLADPSTPASSSVTIPARDVSSGEVFAATLASLRLHPSLPIPRTFLASLLLRTGCPLLSSAISPLPADPADRPDTETSSSSASSEAALEREIAQLCLEGDSDPPASASQAGAVDLGTEPSSESTPAESRREILRRVVGVQMQRDQRAGGGGGDDQEGAPRNGDDPGAADSRDVGRNVRSL